MGNKPSSTPAPAPPPPPPPPPPPAPAVATTFTQPTPPNINLTVSTSKNCAGCAVGSGAGTSSSAITLTRNVLPAISANRKPVIPPSNLPKTGDEGHTGDPGNSSCSGGCYYSPPFPSNDPKTTVSATASPPTVLSDMATAWQNNGTDYRNKYNAQKRSEEEMIQRLTLAASMIKANRMWNPSDDPKDPLGSYAINYKNYGALTKLYLRPTLPFTVNYSGI